MQKLRIVISGINGFVGHHLAQRLAKNNISVVGIGNDKAVASGIGDIVDKYYSQDLTVAWPDINDVDAIIHLAGLAAVGPSFDNPQQYINANSAMVTNMCEYYLGQEKKPRILIVSSGAVYDSHQAMPLTESSLVGFSSPYTVSKILTENQCAYYKNRGLDCVIARPFNHIGPGQGKGFILPDFFKKLSELDSTTAIIKVGNIDTRRDYTDVRDIVDAYTKLILSPSLNYTVYNICSGTSLSGTDILNTLKRVMDKNDVQFVIDQSLIRPTDAMEIYGDSSRLRNELGWKPEYSIKTTISDFVAAARK